MLQPQRAGHCAKSPFAGQDSGVFPVNRIADAVSCGFEAFCSSDWSGKTVDAQQVANNLVSWYAQTIGPLRFIWLYADERALAGRILAGMIRAHFIMLNENVNETPLRMGGAVVEAVVHAACGSGAPHISPVGRES